MTTTTTTTFDLARYGFNAETSAKIAALPLELRPLVADLALKNNFRLIGAQVTKCAKGYADELAVYAWTTATVAELSARDGWTARRGWDQSYRFTRDV